MTGIRFKSLVVTVAAAFVAMACGTNNTSGTGSDVLATDQTLTFPIQDDIQTLDPGHVQSGVDITFTTEMFAGLYGLDNGNKIINMIATGPPDVSSDGKTYTFHMRKDAKFWNGDPIKSADVLYSWNRVAVLNDAYATVFQPVVGFDDTSNGKTKAMSGLTAPDDYTVKATLTDAAGYWLSELSLWTAAVVSQKAISAAGEDIWWTKPDTAVGAGPFKMTERTAKASMAFQPVANWWGGSTGALKNIKVEIGVDAASQVKKYESGGYDLVGLADNYPGPDDILRYKADPTKQKEENIYPAARTTWVMFNFTGNSPFAPKAGIAPGQPTAGLSADDGKAGRNAFSLSIDRAALVDVACSKGATCTAATGGLMAKGLKGYVGDGKDPNAVFNAATAKADYTKWDPNGSKIKGLTYRYNASAGNTAIAQNLQSQWKANLGINIDLAPSDFPTLIADRNAKKTNLARGSWGADYDHPQDWFDNLWICAAAQVGHGGEEGYCNPAMDKVLATANAESIDKALPSYQQAGQTLIDDNVDAVLFYGTATYFTHTYVKGAGFNSLYDYNWQGIKILKH
ncbi:MAG TPA: peptide ABC transporter substrate-binding protein [Candidatus Dormibacteraeota bacterium]|jgi:oligopeptide transport system substrate-binding protein